MGLGSSAAINIRLPHFRVVSNGHWLCAFHQDLIQFTFIGLIVTLSLYEEGKLNGWSGKHII